MQGAVLSAEGKGIGRWEVEGAEAEAEAGAEAEGGDYSVKYM